MKDIFSSRKKTRFQKNRIISAGIPFPETFLIVPFSVRTKPSNAQPPAATHAAAGVFHFVPGKKRQKPETEKSRVNRIIPFRSKCHGT